MPTLTGIVVPTSHEASGRRAFSDIIDELARPVNAGDDTVRALAADAFRAAVRTMNRKGSWPWEIQDSDISITANQARYTLASGSQVKKPLAMHYLSASGGVRDQRLAYERYDLFVERRDQNITGEASVYSIPNLFESGDVIFFPTPSGNDNVRFTYYRVTPSPRLDTEPVEIPDFAIEVYMSYAWLEFVKRCPQAKTVLDLGAALENSRTAFREISSNIASPGDRSRHAYSPGM